MRIRGRKINTNAQGSQTAATYFQVNPVRTMAIGDADQQLGFISKSGGSVTYVSSDIAKATIVFSSGNYFLHAVATGDITVTGSQAASGIYVSGSNVKKASVVVATTTTDTFYSTVALGKAGTANGSSFNVNNSNGFTYRKYLMVSGSAVYQGTYPVASITTGASIITKLYNQDVGAMPQTPLVDIDSLQTINHLNRFKNIGGSTTLDNNFAQRFSYSTFTDSGTIVLTQLNTNEVQVVYTSAQSSLYASFISFNQLYLPAGLWNFSCDIRLLPGDSGKSCYCGIKLDTTAATYQTIALSTTPTTVNFGTVENNTDANSTFNQFVVAANNVHNTPVTLSIIISNRRLTPGSASGSATAITADPVLFTSNRFIAAGVNSDLSWTLRSIILADNIGNSLLSAAVTFTTYPYCMLYAIKLQNNGINNALMYSEDGNENFFIAGNPPGGNTGLLSAAGLSVPVLTSYNLLDGNWVILGVAANTANTISDLYINGFRVYRSYGNISLASFVNLYLMGSNNTNFKNDLYFSGVTVWNTALSDSDVYNASNILIERMRLKNMFLQQSLTDTFFYLCEGDSITAVLQGNTLYSTVYRANYTPQLFGFVAAVNGSVLGAPGDAEPTNSVWARQARVIASINNAFAKGYTRVVFSILIGANDIKNWTTTGLIDTYYASLCSYCDSIKATGAKLIMCTMTDINNASFGVTTNKTFLNYYNNKIRVLDGHKDGICDFNANPAFNVATTTYYNSDLVHPNATGQALMGTIIKTPLDNLLT